MWPIFARIGRVISKLNELENTIDNIMNQVNTIDNNTDNLESRLSLSRANNLDDIRSSHIRSIQFISEGISSTDGSGISINISSVNRNKSFIIMHNSGDSSDPGGNHVTVYFESSNEITVLRDVSTGSVYCDIQIIEFW
ncbi:hypothetical protein [Salibacterium aidingense]|uniref:hypothetical protein n=1 Tax=Salibacterium aidingense TaxID=384933 RepID=UPI003BED4E39